METNFNGEKSSNLLILSLWKIIKTLNTSHVSQSRIMKQKIKYFILMKDIFTILRKEKHHPRCWQHHHKWSMRWFSMLVSPFHYSFSLSFIFSNLTIQIHSEILYRHVHPIIIIYLLMSIHKSIIFEFLGFELRSDSRE